MIRMTKRKPKRMRTVRAWAVVGARDGLWVVHGEEPYISKRRANLLDLQLDLQPGDRIVRVEIREVGR